MYPGLSVEQNVRKEWRETSRITKGVWGVVSRIKIKEKTKKSRLYNYKRVSESTNVSTTHRRNGSGPWCQIKPMQERPRAKVVKLQNPCPLPRRVRCGVCPRSISNTVTGDSWGSAVADASALLPTSITNLAISPRVLGPPHLPDLRFEIPNLTLQFPDMSLPILLSAIDLPLESTDDVRSAIVTARLSRSNSHRSREFLAYVAERDEIGT